MVELEEEITAEGLVEGTGNVCAKVQMNLYPEHFLPCYEIPLHERVAGHNTRWSKLGCSGNLVSNWESLSLGKSTTI